MKSKPRITVRMATSNSLAIVVHSGASMNQGTRATENRRAMREPKVSYSAGWLRFDSSVVRTLASNLMKITEPERIIRHKRFLQANWKMLAAFSWEYFQKEGRGAVVADEGDFIQAPKPQYARISLRYIPENSPRLKEVGGWPGDKEAGWVKSYDPKAQMVILIVRENGGTSGYLLSPRIQPPEAFAQEQARKN